MKILKLFLLLAFTFSTHATATDAPTWQADKSGVAWSVTKRQFLVMNKKVYGYNYDITTQLVPADGNTVTIVVDIPIDKFSSGEADRDQAVAEALKSDVRKNMTFTSEPLTKDALNQITSRRTNAIKGQLAIADKSYPVTFNVRFGTDNFLYGDLKTKMTDLGVTPPVAAGGIVMKVADELNLLAKISLSQLAH